MCGIVGFAGAGAPDGLDLGAAVAAMHHRGPDDQGNWREGSAGLGFARLSIIDLSPAGHQPMASPDGRHVIVFNGEIYNFGELRRELEACGETFRGHSDTEVLLRLFVRDGLEACLAKLHGMFAFAVWDRATGTLSLARDRLGVKPLVYAETAAGFLFASEIKPLFALYRDLPRLADGAALDHYLTYQYIPAPLTGFAAIRKLPPGHAMTVRDGRIATLARYWDVDPAAGAELPFADACEQLREQVLEATRVRMVADVPLGAFLSGGIDSSITVAAMSRLSSDPVKTYAIGFEDERFNELPHARQAAQHLGTDHHEMIVRADAAAIVPQLIEHFGEPHADNSAIPTYYVAQLARQGVTVALTGDGGDEAFAGYRRFYHAALAERAGKARLLPAWRMARRLTTLVENGLRGGRGAAFPASRADQSLFLPAGQRYKHLIAYFTDADKAGLLTAAFREQTGRVDTTAFLGQWLERARGADPINRHLYADLHTYLPEDVLPKVDICSMMNSLECRSPFLDHRLVEFAARLPGRYKMKWPHRHKHILREAFRGWLPAGFLERGKMGFSPPLARWLRGDLSGLLRERLVAESGLAPWFDQGVIARMVTEHVNGTASHAKRLWALLVLAEWKSAFAVPDGIQ
jgi:asparagine synthase (glutamine-hydrolysing)